jgi:hypothetical protein
MERVVRVNAIRGSNDAVDAFERQTAMDEERTGLDWESSNAAGGAGAAARFAGGVDQGPCLYFGPAGQRCDRRAVADGFCARHAKGASLNEATVTLSPRKVIAILAAGVALWPILADLIRAILRYIR